MLRRDDAFSDILNTALFSAAAALLFSAGNLLPFLGWWGQALSPLPLALTGCRRGFARMYAGAVFSAVLLMLPVLPGLPMHPLLVMYFLVGYVPLAFAIVFAARRRLDIEISLILCMCVSIVSKLVMMIAFWALTGRNFMMPDAGQLKLTLEGIYSAPSSDAAAVETVMVLMRLIPYMIPSILMIISGIESVICCALCERFQRGRRGEVSPMHLPQYTDWRFSQTLLPAMLLSFLLGIAWNIDEWTDGAMFAVNLKLLLNILFFIQGISVIFWWMNKRGLGRGAKIAAAVLMLVPLAWVWVILMGVTDMAIDMRTRFARR